MEDSDNSVSDIADCSNDNENVNKIFITLYINIDCAIAFQKIYLSFINCNGLNVDQLFFFYPFLPQINRDLRVFF